MTNNVWYLTAPDGRVVGASARSAWAALPEGLSQITQRDIWLAMCEAMIANPTATRYESAGYVLALVEVPAHA